MAYDRGETAELSTEVKDGDVLADPATLKLLVLRPDGVKVERTYPEGISKSEVGKYSADVDLTEPGTWHYRWEATEPAQVDPGELVVIPDAFDTDDLLCLPADVERALGGATVSEDQSVPAIYVATEWLRTELGRPELGKSGTVTSTEQDVRMDAFVRAPATVTKVEVVRAAGGDPEALPDDAWTYDGDGVRLRPAEVGPWGVDPRYTSQEDENFLPWWYVEVRVTSEVQAAIDPRIRQACAIAAGALVTRGPRAVRGVRSENIGDYSYTLEQIKHEDPFFEQARSLARPLGSRGPFVV